MMQPGRELDALVAEKVMGVKREHLYDKFTGKLLVSEHFGPPFYSTDIEDAWTVVEKLSERLQFWIEFYRDDQGPWCAMFFKERDSYGEVNAYSATGQTAPHAICLAALKAVGVEEMS